ncbi:MAG: hypothetical protein P1U56_25905 [Saprospiraceae bacterium]|nr:hypothetical protein [Saprospiraceae bacterium]
MKPLYCKNILLLLVQLQLLIAGVNLQAQIKPLESFRELSYKNLPFEEPFILSVKIPEEVDKVECWIFYRYKYTAKIKKRYLPFDAKVKDSLQLETAIYKKDTQKYCDIYIKPLHPNESYQFKFKIWRSKKLSTTDQDLFKKQVPKIITKHISSFESINDTTLKNVKKEVEAFLSEKFDFNVDSLRTWSDEKYSVDVDTEPWTGFINDGGRLKSNYDESKTEFIDLVESLVDKLDSQFHNSIDKLIRDEKNLTKASKEVWNTSPVFSNEAYKSLSLDQIIKILSLEMNLDVKDLILGKRKIEVTGNVTPIQDLSQDLSIDNKNIELLRASFYILLTKGLSVKKGPIVKGNFKTQIDDILDILNELLIAKNELKTKSLESFVADIPKKLGRLYNIENKTYDIDTEVNVFAEASKNPYIGLDLGLGYEHQSQSFYIYEGVNFYLVAVNKKTPFSLYRNWDYFLKRFSLFMSFSQNIGSAKSDAFLPLVNPGGDNMGFQGNLMFGCGYRITRIARVNFALVATRANNYNPFEDNQLKLLPTLNISMELDVAKGIQTLFGLN